MQNEKSVLKDFWKLVLKHSGLKIHTYGHLRFASFTKVLNGQWFENPNLRPLTSHFARKSS